MTLRKIDENMIDDKFTKKVSDLTTKSDVLSSQLADTVKQTELEVERERINNFAKLGEGSTTGDAELIDGRVGADGILYSNLGGAIRAQFSKADDRISTQEELLLTGKAKQTLSHLSWEIGSFTDTGIPYHIANRIRTTVMYRLEDYDVTVKAKDGFGLNVFRYDLDGNFTRRLYADFVGEHKLQANAQYKFILRRNDNSNFLSPVQDGMFIELSNPLLQMKTIKYTSILENYYYREMEYSKIPLALQGWNTLYFTAKPYTKYEYSGIKTPGGTPQIVFLNNDVVLDDVKLAIGVNIITTPSGTNRIGVSIITGDINGFKLTETKEMATERIDERFKQNNSIKLLDFHRIPPANGANMVAIKPSMAVIDHKFSGLSFSDGVVWRWVDDSSLTIAAKGYLTMKISDGSVIGSTNADVVMETASVTKLLSCYIATRHVSDLNEVVTIIPDDVVTDFLDYFVQAGDKVTYNDLIIASLLPSDNNACHALARLIGYIIKPDAGSSWGARQVFFAEMKRVAVELGMVTAHNFIASWTSMQSSPYELALLYRHVQLNAPAITAVWGLLSYKMVSTDPTKRTWTITSTTNQSARNLIPEFLGGKTGSGDNKGAYGFVWAHKKTGELYTSVFMESNLQNNERFINSRYILDEVYSLDAQ